MAPTDDDAALLTLEVQFDGLITELLAAQEANCDSLIFPDERSPVQDSSQCGIDAESDHETRMKEVEAILARLYPIEQAIIQTPACTVAGLGVKARHAAYVMSQYWEGSIEGMDWHARTVRLLIESVCDVAHASLPLKARRV
ncbi:hypothetical protein LMTR13_10305 [Bradyrhizobium icense]|uniref:Uncharacterized protein n=1 Tax=Bradyrhizobium icense TaxID=1274631 RepID=A0A1B1US34_9BRAD|nr:hypothetical protein LMTR13_10305 [Bradyrhizobium icense]